MKKRILAYLAYIDELLEKEDLDWEKEIKKHLVQIGFFAHERLVHLIVMALFAIGTVISILYLNYSGELIILALTIAFLIFSPSNKTSCPLRLIILITFLLFCQKLFKFLTLHPHYSTLFV